jgi:uncharacterized delta-60 repeat protein
MHSRLVLAIVFALTATLLRAQTALDNFDPNVNGVVRVIVVQPDGKILIGGLFSELAPNGGPPVARANIARVNADGSIDDTFNPGANSDIYSIALQGDKILVGGYFTMIGGQFRNRIARLNMADGVPDTFNPGANEVVRSIVLQSDGKILVGGGFIVFGGQSRRYIARLDPITGQPDSFNPNANDNVYSIGLQTDGKIVVGGTFTTIGGQNRNRIARLDPATGAADAFDPNSDSDVLSIAIQSNGKIIAGGFYTTIGGQPRNNIARLDPVTGLADSFNPNANATVQTAVIDSQGRILIGGGFTSLGGPGGVPRGRIARLDPITGAPDLFNPNAGGAVSTIAIQPDGKILAGGIFTTMSTEPRGRIARISSAELRLRIDLISNQRHSPATYSNPPSTSAPTTGAAFPLPPSSPAQITSSPTPQPTSPASTASANKNAHCRADEPPRASISKGSLEFRASVLECARSAFHFGATTLQLHSALFVSNCCSLGCITVAGLRPPCMLVKRRRSVNLTFLYRPNPTAAD